MLKKLLIIVLLCSTNLHATQQGNFTYTPKSDSLLRDFVGLLALGALRQAAPKIDKYIQEYAATLNEEELEKFVIRINRAVLALQIAVGIYVVVVFYPIFKDLYDYCYPSEAKKAAIKAAIEANKLFDAEHNFVECLLSNRQTARNDAGLPTVCENFGETYRMVAGQEKFDDRISGLKSVNY